MRAYMHGQTFRLLLLYTRLSCLLLGSVTWTLVDTNLIPVWLQNLFPVNYSSALPPVTYRLDNSVEPVVVYCSLRPEFVTMISMKTMDFEVDMQLNIEWNDLRLNYIGHEDSITSATDVPVAVATKMWKPWLIFENAKGTNNLLITAEVTKIGPLWTDAKRMNKVGINIYYRKIFRFTCQLNFVAYPFDMQNCAIVVRWDSGVNPYNPVTVQLSSVDTSRINVPPGFRLASFTIENGLNNTISSPYGTIMRLRTSMVFVFERVFAQHLMLIFLPSMLIVALSWAAFWLDAGNATPRIALGLTTLLTLSTQFSSAQRDLPPVADIKALDIWMFTCIFMVFLSLVEFFVTVIYERMRRANLVRDKNKIKPVGEKLKRENIHPFWYLMQRHESTSKIDYISRIVFPLSFLIFNLAFWSHYLGGR